MEEENETLQTELKDMLREKEQVGHILKQQVKAYLHLQICHSLGWRIKCHLIT